MFLHHCGTDGTVACRTFAAHLGRGVAGRHEQAPRRAAHHRAVHTRATGDMRLGVHLGVVVPASLIPTIPRRGAPPAASCFNNTPSFTPHYARAGCRGTAHLQRRAGTLRAFSLLHTTCCRAWRDSSSSISGTCFYYLSSCSLSY